MKQIYPLTHFSKSLLTAVTLLLGMASFSQTVPELVFKNPTRNGQTSAIGTVYTFSEVTTGINALVEITGKSHSSVRLSSIDLTNSGYDNAFQPQVSYNSNDQAPQNTTWWMEFTISFVQSAAPNDPVTVSSFYASALDIDGDNNRLREQVAFYGFSSYTLENPTSLTITDVTGGKIFSSPYTEYANINTSATNIMVTTQYTNTSSFKIRVGGSTGNRSASNTNRMNSIWFKTFTYNTPTTVMPITLVSFLANRSTKGVTLDWASSMEESFSHFIVQRSTNGSNYDDIATIFSDGENHNSLKTYAFADLAPTASDIVYYRLKMVDIDTKYTYSEVKVIRNNKPQEQAAVTLFPNPATSYIRVSVPAGWQNKPVNYTVHTINGAVVKQVATSRASQTETIDLSGLNPAVYILKATAGKEVSLKQFTRQ